MMIFFVIPFRVSHRRLSFFPFYLISALAPHTLTMVPFSRRCCSSSGLVDIYVCVMMLMLRLCCSFSLYHSVYLIVASLFFPFLFHLSSGCYHLSRTKLLCLFTMILYFPSCYHLFHVLSHMILLPFFIRHLVFPRGYF